MTETSAAPGFQAGLLAAVPIVLGYVPIAFYFGVAAVQAGLTAPEAVMLSLLLRRDLPPVGPLARFLAATGPAAIATLFVASVLPQLVPVPRDVLALALGTAATVLAYLPRRSVVAATLCGAAAYGGAIAALG